MQEAIFSTPSKHEDGIRRRAGFRLLLICCEKRPFSAKGSNNSDKPLIWTRWIIISMPLFCHSTISEVRFAQRNQSTLALFS